MNKLTIITILVIMLLSVVLVACEGNVFSLKAGDCFNGPLTNPEYSVDVTDVELVSCDEPHQSEVYASFELPDSIWKSEDYVFEQGAIGCKARFETFVGIEYELSTLDVSINHPSVESWIEMDDRGIRCILSDGTGDMKAYRSGSLKGSRR